ncbi:MAG: hypothetical protein JSR83_08010 [Proteobacteria bacterium]|nr:hypothetical protein [Pseudomonadota bacterium]
MKRAHGLILALGAVLAAAWWAAGLDDEGDGSTRPVRKAGRAPRSVAVPPMPLGELRLGARPPADGVPGELFPARSFQPPPPPPPVDTKPVAPPLPYRYGGALEDGGVPAAFLLERDEVRAVRPGDVLDGRYRVTAVSRQRIDFLYLPLNETQSLSTGTP